MLAHNFAMQKETSAVTQLIQSFEFDHNDPVRIRLTNRIYPCVKQVFAQQHQKIGASTGEAGLASVS